MSQPTFSAPPNARPDSACLNDNRLREEDRPAHDWYRFVLAFPPHLTREYLRRFGATEDCTVLDPFCGTGTTLAESKKLGIGSIGVEANPVAAFAADVKTRWSVDPKRLREHASRVAYRATSRLAAHGLSEHTDSPLFAPAAAPDTLVTLPPAAASLLLKGSISPLPLHRSLTLLETIRGMADPHVSDHECLAFMRTAVYHASNLHFGPEVGVRKAKTDAPVVSVWHNAVTQMAEDVAQLRDQVDPSVAAKVIRGDARQLDLLLQPESIDVVITSPPYPNEKDYTRTTRLELVLLGYIRDKTDLRALKQGLLRSNTRGVYKLDSDADAVLGLESVERVAAEIERRRLELGKTSGFERMYARVTRLYFGGMKLHFASLRSRLKPGARLAYVVGDQASYLQVPIRTGTILAEIAESLGYEVCGIDLFRMRFATATRQELREEVLLLRWPGPAGSFSDA